jgi:hypothetical protein
MEPILQRHGSLARFENKNILFSTAYVQLILIMYLKNYYIWRQALHNTSDKVETFKLTSKFSGVKILRNKFNN